MPRLLHFPTRIPMAFAHHHHHIPTFTPVWSGCTAISQRIGYWSMCEKPTPRLRVARNVPAASADCRCRCVPRHRPPLVRLPPTPPCAVRIPHSAAFEPTWCVWDFGYCSSTKQGCGTPTRCEDERWGRGGPGWGIGAMGRTSCGHRACGGAVTVGCHPSRRLLLLLFLLGGRRPR